jgi:competence CoiA-like predicted nuclease
MPPKGTNGDWLVNSGTGKLYIRESDGGFVPFDAIREVHYEDILTNEAAKRFKYDFTPSDMIGKTHTCSATIRLPHKAQIKMARIARAVIKSLRRYNNGTRRIIRTMKRQTEKERRRRLKEVSGDD